MSVIPNTKAKLAINTSRISRKLPILHRGRANSIFFRRFWQGFKLWYRSLPADAGRLGKATSNGPSRHLFTQGGWQQCPSQCPCPRGHPAQYLAAVSPAAPTGTALPKAADTAKGCSQGWRGEAKWLSSPGPGGLWRQNTQRKAALNVWVIAELLLFILLNRWAWAPMS